MFVAGSRVSGRLCRLVWAISELGPGNRDHSCTYSKSWHKRPSRTLALVFTQVPGSIPKVGAWRFGCSSKLHIGEIGGRAYGSTRGVGFLPFSSDPKAPLRERGGGFCGRPRPSNTSRDLEKKVGGLESFWSGAVNTNFQIA